MRYADQFEQMPWDLRIALGVVGVVVMTFAGLLGLVVLKVVVFGLC
jgi:hypothetical protein